MTPDERFGWLRFSDRFVGMALKFRLKGLAETFVEHITCPGCGACGNDDQHFMTDLTRVTYEGIVVVSECKSCGEIFVPELQRLGVVNRARLYEAVQKDASDTGEPLFQAIQDVRFHAERLNAARKGDLH